jgi:hypothetical protein
VVAVFDLDPEQVETRVGNLVVNHVSRMEQEIKSKDIRITIVAVPGDYGSDCCGSACLLQNTRYSELLILGSSGANGEFKLGI